VVRARRHSPWSLLSRAMASPSLLLDNGVTYLGGDERALRCDGDEIYGVSCRLPLRSKSQTLGFDRSACTSKSSHAGSVCVAATMATHPVAFSASTPRGLLVDRHRDCSFCFKSWARVKTCFITRAAERPWPWVRICEKILWSVVVLLHLWDEGRLCIMLCSIAAFFAC
jgi:hypothetical protein